MSRRAVYLVVIRQPLDDATLKELVEELRRQQHLVEVRGLASRNEERGSTSESDGHSPVTGSAGGAT